MSEKSRILEGDPYNVDHLVPRNLNLGDLYERKKEAGVGEIAKTTTEQNKRIWRNLGIE